MLCRLSADEPLARNKPVRDRTRRLSGASKYSLTKMVGLALDGITSFSTAPLRFVSFLGFSIFLASMIVTAWALWAKLFTDYAAPGWTSTVLPMYVLGGVQNTMSWCHRQISRQSLCRDKVAATVLHREGYRLDRCAARPE
jgi:hypothetical protein